MHAPPPLDDDTTVVVPRIQIPSQQLCLNELQTQLDALDQAYDGDYVACLANLKASSLITSSFNN